VKHDPGPGLRQHTGERDLPGILAAFCCSQRTGGHGVDGGRQSARVQSPSGRSASQRSTPGVVDSTSPCSERTTRPGESGHCGSRASPTSSPVLAPVARSGPIAFTNALSSLSNSGSPGGAIEADCAPDRPAGAQRGDHLLVAAHLHVHVPARARRRIASGRLVQGRDPGLRAGDVCDLVDVVAVVLVIEHFGRELGQPIVVVAGDQKRCRVQRVPARRVVVGTAVFSTWVHSRQKVTRSYPRLESSAIRSLARSFASTLMSTG
jgi:hypothetical protein